MTDKIEVSECVHERNTEESTISDATFEKAANLFYALGDASRLKLLEKLLRREWCVTELAESLKEEISTVSQRLKLLRTLGIVQRRREGKHIYYKLSDQHICDLIANALAHADE
ncbi:MAG: helix-turn-helix domain-containing protein [Acidobacteriota bacterium]|nr:helix-turn-helix domain-containing protein [Blastocatellia bacterium]MDW8411250.1 helix-turn-helix domain-containing protein [Acidobacteriota bacterium]